MKIEMAVGCTADYLGVDGISEVDMTEEQRRKTWKAITQEMHLRDPKSDDLNQLLQFLVHHWGKWKYGRRMCECCGDTIDRGVLEL